MQADAVVVVELVQEEGEAPHLHNHHPRCKVSANPGCKLLHDGHLDKDHKKMHHPICCNSTVTSCPAGPGLVVLGLGLVLVVALVLAMGLESALVESALGLEKQGNPHLSCKP